LKLLTGEESFLPIGAKEREASVKGEFAYVDSCGHVLCRLDVMQSDDTKVREDTTEVLMIVEGTIVHRISDLQAAMDQTIDLVTRFCGGRAEVVARPE
jgi:DNA/RNA-binding domain of Phe-tRNA-synthetase-like protein